MEKLKATACDQSNGRNKAKDSTEPSKDVHVAFVPRHNFGSVILDGSY